MRAAHASSSSTRGRPAGEDAAPADRVRHAGHARSDRGWSCRACAAASSCRSRRRPRRCSRSAPCRSSTGPSSRWRNAAETRCGPALMWIGGVRSSMPFWPLFWPKSVSVIVGLTSSTRHALAVHRDVDLLLEAHRQQRRAAEQAAERGVDHRRLDHVVAVGGEDVDHRRPAAGADRRARGVGHLRAAVLDLVGGRGGAGLAIADRQPADLAGGAQIALHQLRREVLHVGDVVEAGADGVGRQIRADVDVEAEQVAHRGGVLGAVQPLERTPARVAAWRRPPCPSPFRARRPSPASDAGSGRAAPAGGIIPARSFLIIFSATSPFSTCLAASNWASVRPPALPRSLWQVAQ